MMCVSRVENFYTFDIIELQCKGIDNTINFLSVLASRSHFSTQVEMKKNKYFHDRINHLNTLMNSIPKSQKKEQNKKK